MKLPKLTAVIEKEESWFVAHCPELGVTSQGRTMPEAEVRRRLERGVLVKELEPAHA